MLDFVGCAYIAPEDKKCQSFHNFTMTNPKEVSGEQVKNGKDCLSTCGKTLKQ